MPSSDLVNSLEAELQRKKSLLGEEFYQKKSKVMNKLKPKRERLATLIKQIEALEFRIGNFHLASTSLKNVFRAKYKHLPLNLLELNTKDKRTIVARAENYKREKNNIEEEIKEITILINNEQKIIDTLIASETKEIKERLKTTKAEYLKNKTLIENKISHYNQHYQRAVLDCKESNQIRKRIAQRIRTDLSTFSSTNFTAEKLNWKLLPASEISIVRIKQYLLGLSKFSSEDFDFEKIDKIISLRADKVYCGTDEFEGYLVFCFEKFKIAVLDCPRKGNAIYIFGEDWKALSKLSKYELLNFHPNKTQRIIHRGDWFEKLKLTLSVSNRKYSHW